jgi:23S rRNA (cytidine2498-2'-O)-methyltransferase
LPHNVTLVQAICTTSQPGFAREGLIEIKSRIDDTSPISMLAPGIRLLATALPYAEIGLVLRENPPVFVRHICPASAWTCLGANPMASLREVAPWIAELLDPRRTFSVQTRVFGDAVVRRFDANENISSVLEAGGFELNVRRPEEVVSIQIVGSEAWIGVSKASENLSDWAGGERRYKRDCERISRAEFKLLEAIDTFKIPLPRSGRAIDLGAAPGGWSRTLVERGLHVTAVDPAALDGRLRLHPMVRHLRVRAQESEHLLAGTFEVLFSDMRMDSIMAAQIMCGMKDHLKHNGIFLVTLKLPRRQATKKMERAIGILRTHFVVKEVRQLFHNRSEVMAYGLKR